MASLVFANNNEIACKAAQGKSICCFPDVCMTPPENPATPPGVPVPYPNTGMASDTTEGSRTVMVAGQEIMLKNKSYFKTSTGDEAGAATKKGVLTSVNKGKVFFAAWSMDVKIEDENVDRHLDMTLHNEASDPPNALTMLYVDGVAVPLPESCADAVREHDRACRGADVKRKKGKPAGRNCDNAADPQACRDAKKCLLVPKRLDKNFCCSETSTGHHMIEDQWIKQNSNFPLYLSSRTNPPQVSSSTVLSGDQRSEFDAPCVCVNRQRSVNTPHRSFHDIQGFYVEAYQPGGALQSEPFDYGAAKQCSLNAHDDAYGDAKCNRDCLSETLDQFYGSDTTRTMNLPTTAQGLGDPTRATLQTTYGQAIQPAEGLTHSMGDILKAAGIV